MIAPEGIDNAVAALHELPRRPDLLGIGDSRQRVEITRPVLPMSFHLAQHLLRHIVIERRVEHVERAGNAARLRRADEIRFRLPRRAGMTGNVLRQRKDMVLAPGMSAALGADRCAAGIAAPERNGPATGLHVNPAAAA